MRVFVCVCLSVRDGACACFWSVSGDATATDDALFDQARHIALGDDDDVDYDDMDEHNNANSDASHADGNGRPDADVDRLSVAMQTTHTQ